MANLRSDCRLCNALSASVPAEFDRPVLECDGHVAIASLGALVEGWSLVLPKRHVLSVRHLEPSEMPELEAFLARAKRHVETVYGPSVLFEHGPSHARTRVGCGVDHAHVHVVPWDRPGLVDVVTRECPSLAWASASTLADAHHLVPADTPYVWLCTPERAAVGWGSRVPSQLVRRVMAQELGVPTEFDWRTYPREERVLAAIEALRQTRPALAFGPKA